MHSSPKGIWNSRNGTLYIYCVFASVCSVSCVLFAYNREQERPAVATSNQESQTDPPETPPSLEESEAPLEPETSSEHEIEQEYEQPVKKKRRKVLDLLKYAKRGQVRSQSWVVKVVGQLCADKAVADAAADAQGQGRGGMAEFIMNWHMNRWAG